MEGHELSDDRFCGGTGGVKYYCNKGKYLGCSKNKKCQQYFIPKIFGGKTGYRKSDYKALVKECEAGAGDIWSEEA